MRSDSVLDVSLLNRGLLSAEIASILIIQQRQNELGDFYILLLVFIIR